jgi:hypothetical protein
VTNVVDPVILPVTNVVDPVILPVTNVDSVKPAFNPKLEAGVSGSFINKPTINWLNYEISFVGPFGFFDPLGICPPEKADFMKYRESELKHGRIAMLAVLGALVGESGFTFFGDSITGIINYATLLIVIKKI